MKEKDQESRKIKESEKDIVKIFDKDKQKEKQEETDKVAKYLSKEENSSSLAEKSILFSKVDNRKHSTNSNLASYLDFRNYFKTDILKYESEHRRISKSLGFY